METATSSPLKPRKTPVQSRSTATVVAIFEATIQVLLVHGYGRLTFRGRLVQRPGDIEPACLGFDERVAHRGHDVSDGLALLGAAGLLHRSDDGVEIALQHGGQKRTLVGEILVKRADRDPSALGDPGGSGDRSFADLALPAMVLTTATVGPVQAAIEAGADPGLMKALQAQLVELCMGYLERISTPKAST
jgi:hypothetical protein